MNLVKEILNGGRFLMCIVLYNLKWKGENILRSAAYINACTCGGTVCTFPVIKLLHPKY